MSLAAAQGSDDRQQFIFVWCSAHHAAVNVSVLHMISLDHEIYLRLQLKEKIGVLKKGWERG